MDEELGEHRFEHSARHWVSGWSTNSSPQPLPTWIPATAPVDVLLVQAPHVVIWMSCFQVSPNGMTFQVESIYDPSRERTFAAEPQQPLDVVSHDLETVTTALDDLDGIWAVNPGDGKVEPNDASDLRVGLSFGGKSAEVHDFDVTSESGIALFAFSGSSSNGRRQVSLSCSAVPDSEVTFWAAWPQLEIEEAAVAVGHKPFQEALARAVSVWG